MNKLILIFTLLMGITVHAADRKPACDICGRMKRLTQIQGAEELSKHLNEVFPIVDEFKFKPSDDAAMVREKANSVSDLSATYIPVEQETEGTVDLMEKYYQIFNENPAAMTEARGRLDAKKQAVLIDAQKQMKEYYKCGTGGCANQPN